MASSAEKDQTDTENISKQPFNSWELSDDATIDYGCFNKTGGAGISKETKGNSFYLTTAINYTNGPAHMGHAYEATTSDALSRYARLKGVGPVYFLTGSDEHGQKIATTASGEGKEPIKICVRKREEFGTSFFFFCSDCSIEQKVHSTRIEP